MPTVAVSPLTRTHSCDLAYFRSDGTLLINIHRRLRGQDGFSTHFLTRISRIPTKKAMQVIYAPSGDSQSGYFFSLKSRQARFILPSVLMWTVKTPTPRGSFTPAMLVMRFQ